MPGENRASCNGRMMHRYMRKSRQIDRKTDERADDMQSKRVRRIMTVRNISGQFTARKTE